MKFLIAGAGAIGAYMGACMARAGQDVTLFARGPHLRAMQEHKFDKAKPHFQKVIAGPVRELVDRASIHLSICTQHLERSVATQFKTPEEHFDFAVSLMNVGDYVTAREHLEKLVVAGLPEAARYSGARSTEGAERNWEEVG